MAGPGTADIRIDSSSDIPIRQQLIEQIIFQIATGAWTTDHHLPGVRELRQPSTIAVVSASPHFLEVARGVLAPAIGTRHQLREVLLPDENLPGHRAIDLMFCDSIARRRLRHPRLVHYQIASPKSLEEIAGAMKAYRIYV